MKIEEAWINNQKCSIMFNEGNLLVLHMYNCTTIYSSPRVLLLLAEARKSGHNNNTTYVIIIGVSIFILVWKMKKNGETTKNVQWRESTTYIYVLVHCIIIIVLLVAKERAVGNNNNNSSQHILFIWFINLI